MKGSIANHVQILVFCEIEGRPVEEKKATGGSITSTVLIPEVDRNVLLRITRE
jgi:hypothetical protein